MLISWLNFFNNIFKEFSLWGKKILNLKHIRTCPESGSILTFKLGSSSWRHFRAFSKSGCKQKDNEIHKPKTVHFVLFISRIFKSDTLWSQFRSTCLFSHRWGFNSTKEDWFRNLHTSQNQVLLRLFLLLFCSTGPAGGCGCCWFRWHNGISSCSLIQHQICNSTETSQSSIS